jgi:hypothetical protein
MLAAVAADDRAAGRAGGQAHADRRLSTKEKRHGQRTKT